MQRLRYLLLREVNLRYSLPRRYVFILYTLILYLLLNVKLHFSVCLFLGSIDLSCLIDWLTCLELRVRWSETWSKHGLRIALIHSVRSTCVGNKTQADNQLRESLSRHAVFHLWSTFYWMLLRLSMLFTTAMFTEPLRVTFYTRITLRKVLLKQQWSTLSNFLEAEEEQKQLLRIMLPQRRRKQILWIQASEI